MLQLTSKIVITGDDGRKWKFNGAVETENVTTWETLTDTCQITVPKKLQWLDKSTGQYVPIATTENPLFRKGNEISVSYGYDGKVSEWFKGYISNIYAGQTLALNCQDAMYLLKQGANNLSYEKVTLSQLLKDVLKNTIPYKVVADYDLGQFRTKNNPTAAQIFKYLNENYMMRFFFRDGVLYAGLGIVPELQKEHKLKYVISNNLEYVRKDDVKLKIKAVIMYPDGKSKTIEIGDSDGQQRTLHYYNMSESDVKKICEKELDSLKYEGFKGTLTTFIMPNINHGDIVHLPSGINGMDNTSIGKYIVSKVSKYIKGIQARQEIELEKRVF